MSKIRTFVDSGVLISAARGNDDVSQSALRILGDPKRDFVTSDFVRLEVLPKAVFHGNQVEADYYNAFFAAARRTIHTSKRVVTQAEHEARQHGLSAVDALHVAAAMQGHCQEFVTTEGETKPLFRVSGLNIVSIHNTA